MLKKFIDADKNISRDLMFMLYGLSTFLHFYNCAFYRELNKKPLQEFSETGRDLMKKLK
jgi:hypothetical protein